MPDGRRVGECTEEDCDGHVYQYTAEGGGKSSVQGSSSHLNQGTADPPQNLMGARCVDCEEQWQPSSGQGDEERKSGVDMYIEEKRESSEIGESKQPRDIDLGEESSELFDNPRRALSDLNAQFHGQKQLGATCPTCGDNELTHHPAMESRGVSILSISNHYGESGGYIECENCGDMFKGQDHLQDEIQKVKSAKRGKEVKDQVTNSLHEEATADPTPESGPSKESSVREAEEFHKKNIENNGPVEEPDIEKQPESATEQETSLE